MTDDKVKMTCAERNTAVKKRAREQHREIDELQAQYVTSSEINEVHARHLRELGEILGDLDQEIVNGRRTA